MDFDKVVSQITCPICLSSITECCVTKCGHSFCKSCLIDALNFQERCPYCNSALKKGEYYRFFQFDSLVSFIEKARTSVHLNTIKTDGTKETNEIVREENKSKQMISIKTVVNDETKSERSEIVEVPCDLEKLLNNDLILGESSFTLTVASNNFPLILRTSTAPISIQINSKIKEQKKCLRYRFIKGMNETFYFCKDCNVKFICSSCAEVCHNGHNLEVQMKISCCNAVCYCCRSPAKCQLTN